MGEAAKDQGTLHLVPGSDLLEEIKAFLIACRAKRLSPATVARYERELAKLRAWTEARGIVAVQRIKATDIRQYLIHLEETGHNPGGQHLAYRTIKRFLRWYDNEYEPTGWKNPILKVEAPQVPEEILKPLNLDDLRKILATCQERNPLNDRDRAILLCLLDSGCRASEFVTLKVGDVDTIDGTVIVRRGKGGKDRVVVLGAKSRAALARYLRRRPGCGPADPLWATMVTEEALTYWGLWQIVRRRAAAAGVAMPGLHSFRRTFALLSLRGGMDLETLRRILGHRDLSVIKRYLAQTKDDLREAHERSGPVDNLL